MMSRITAFGRVRTRLGRIGDGSEKRPMKRLEGKRIAIAGPRRASELSRLIENWGGVALVRPAQGTVLIEDAELEKTLDDLIRRPYDWFVVTTGMGLDALVSAARRLGREAEFLEALRGMKLAARGYKALAALRRLGLEPVVRDDDGTTDGVVRAMEAYPLAGARVAVQFYGEPAPDLVRRLEALGATCGEVLPYRHEPPAPEALDTLIAEVESAAVDAVCFTAKPQVRFLFERAEATGRADRLLEAFAGPVVAAAVGKVTAEALRARGVGRVVAPAEERMGAMVAALADFWAGG